MQQTTNYHLLKPDYTDAVDVENLNFNADTIDAALTAKANLVGGKVPASELPSYVDDVIEGYYYNGAFYRDSAHTTAISGETGKIYIDLDSEACYRWTGSVYAQVSAVDLVITGYYYNGDFYSDSLHTELIDGEEGKLYVDINTENCYRWDSVYIQISSPESEIYWATYDTTLDAAGIAAAYAELQAAVSAGQMILLFISPYTYYCSDFIGGVQPAFYFCNYDQFPTLRKYTFSAITGWSAMSQTTIATKTYVDTAIHDAGQLPQGTNQDDILVWDSVLQEWTTASYPSGSLPSGTTDDDILVWDDLNQEWDTRAKGSISNGNTGWVTGGDVYTAIGNIPQIPVGTNTGDILVWDGYDWISQQPGRLPYGYTEVEYLESSGTQYIETDIILKGTTRIVIDFEFKDSFSQWGGIIGTWNENKQFVLTWNNSDGKVDARHGTSYTSNLNFSRNKRYLLSFGETLIECSDLNWSYNRLSFEQSSTIGLFSYGHNKPKAERIWHFYHYESDVLLHEFVPCIRDSDSEPGMYDVVNGVFYTNDGTGDFIVPSES